MSTVIFTLEEFTQVLSGILNKYGLSHSNGKIVGKEYRFTVEVTKFVGRSVCIMVNSSVGRDGKAAPSNDNSIRGWIVDERGNPLGNKTQRWITRQVGWEQRLENMMDKLVRMARSLHYCSVCNSIECVYVVKKDGVNKGRLFKTCKCSDSFRWINDDEVVSTQAMIIPQCPKCGLRMVVRSGKDSTNFWGCSGYPACNGYVSMSSERASIVPDKQAQQSQQPVQARLDIVAVAAKKPRTFTPSKYQTDIFHYVDGWYTRNSGSTSNVLMINALAGSGKTETGKRIVMRLPRTVNAVMVAFNKHIAKTLSETLRAAGLYHVKASTIHSMGFRVLANAFGNVTVDDNKVRSMLDSYMDTREYSYLVSPVRSLVSLVKGMLCEPTNEELMRLCDFYDIDCSKPHRSRDTEDYDVDVYEEAESGSVRNFQSNDYKLAFEAVRYVIGKCKSDAANCLSGRSARSAMVIDYDDMVWLPVALNLPCTPYDFVFVDEAQDLNVCDVYLMRKHMHANTKAVFVGDRYQSMYAFRGTDINSIPNIVSMFDAHEMPLSITYRSPRLAVQMVNEEFDIGLEAADWAIEGEVFHKHLDAAMTTMTSGDLVLCRTNADLVKPCFALIRNGVKAVIRGRDMVTGLIAMIRNTGARDAEELCTLLTDYRIREVGKALACNDASRAEAVSDRVDTIIAVSDGCITVKDVEDKIGRIFTDDVEGVVFSTIHRAKGLEADHVYCLRPDLLPHPLATQPWQHQQERNIKYVMMTRWKKTLTYVLS